MDGRGDSNWRVNALLCAAVALLLLTHTGARSPYTYGSKVAGVEPLRQYGMLVNRDARDLLPVTLFFYEPRRIDFTTAYNLKLPIHPFLAAIGMSFTHSYLAGTLLTNFVVVCVVIIAAVRLARRRGMNASTIALAGLTFFSLPFWCGYVGQPMQYAVASSVNLLIVLVAVALIDEDRATAASFGVLTGLLAVNYDWYVVALALLIYLFHTRALRTGRSWVIYLLASLSPILIWRGVLQLLTNGSVSSEIEHRFVLDVVSSWLATLRQLPSQAAMPFVLTTIGARIGFAEVVGMIYWPLLVACIAALLVRRSDDTPRAATFVGWIVVSYAVEQLFTAAFDWENNPRRAIPVVFAFGLAYAEAIRRTIAWKRWRSLWIALLAMTIVLAYSDRFFSSPAVAYLASGESMRTAPKATIDAVTRGAAVADLPLHDAPQWSEPGRATVRDRDMALPFAIVQLGGLAIACAVLEMARRARLLPRWSARALVVLWALSLVCRFL